MVGGGVFANPLAWIIEALARAVFLAHKLGLEVPLGGRPRLFSVIAVSFSRLTSARFLPFCTQPVLIHHSAVDKRIAKQVDAAIARADGNGESDSE